MSIKLSEAIDKFIRFLESNGRSPSTVVAYKKDIEQLFDYYNSHDLVSEFETGHIEFYINELIEKQTFSLKTISRKINSYKTLFKFLHSEDHTKSDVANDITHPKFEAKPPRILSSLEYKALRDTARSNPRLYAIIEMLLQTGMRIGEVSRLKIEDLNLEGSNPTMTVTSYASNPERVVPLTKDAVEAIENYLESRPSVKDDQGYLFITKTGKHVLVRNIRTMVNGAFKKSGIEDVTVNDIRNTFIVFQLGHGMSIEKVAELVGHQRVSSTEKYLDYVKDKKKENITRIVSL